MGKFADRYFKVDAWSVSEEGFNPEYGEVSESIFSLGNEFTGLRGYFDEGYSGKTLQGSYVNGIYETRPTVNSAYKGMISTSDFMVNSCDWTYTKIECKGEKLDLNASHFSNFKRVLDLRKGTLVREFVWEINENLHVFMKFSRFLSMARSNAACRKIEWRFLKGAAEISVTAGLDFTRVHNMTGRCYWVKRDVSAKPGLVSAHFKTETTGFPLYVTASYDVEGEAFVDGDIPCNRIKTSADGGIECVAHISKTSEKYGEKCETNYEKLLAEQIRWWETQWETSDVVIEGDAEAQQGIRYCIFQLHQTLHTGEHGAVFGAKGLTGEAYNGNTFWDSEVYCLMFYLFNNPRAARSILQFRYDTLNEARARARALDCGGAFYPIATISGRECCDLWQHASLQLQASTGVAYGIWNYFRLTGDDEFLYDYGMEIMIEVCRMLAERGGFDQTTGEFGYYGVMGPDEFQVMVNNNAYTNLLAKKTFEYTQRLLIEMRLSHSEKYEKLCEKINFDLAEAADWQQKNTSMRIPRKGRLIEQHDGFFRLPHIDVSQIPASDFPLYSHWTYDRIYRNDMIKQPDVLMFMLMFNGEFDPEEIRENYDYYEPRCIHESSLSPSVHSILANRLDYREQAYDFFKFASRMDLDNYNRNTGEGIHTTSLAATWQNVVYGFGGLRSDGGAISIDPALPDGWEKLSFKLLFRDSLISVETDREQTTVRVERGEPVAIALKGKKLTIDGNGVTL